MDTKPVRTIKTKFIIAERISKNKEKIAIVAGVAGTTATAFVVTTAVDNDSDENSADDNEN